MRCTGLLLTIVLAVGVTAGFSHAADKAEGLKQQGKVELKSAGALAFGPSGVLFIGDSQGAAIYAVGVETKAGPALKEGFKLEGLNKKVAALLGTKPEDVM